MTGTASHPFVDTLRNGLKWLKSFEDVMDLSMDEVLLVRVTALEQAVSTLATRIEGLTAQRPSFPPADMPAAPMSIRLDTQ